MVKVVHPAPKPLDMRWHARLGRWVRSALRQDSSPAKAREGQTVKHGTTAFRVACCIGVAVLLVGFGLPLKLPPLVLLGIALLVAAVGYLIVFRTDPARIVRRAFVSVSLATATMLLLKGIRLTIDLTPVLQAVGLDVNMDVSTLEMRLLSWTSVLALLFVIFLLYLGMRIESREG